MLAGGEAFDKLGVEDVLAILRKARGTRRRASGASKKLAYTLLLIGICCLKQKRFMNITSPNVWTEPIIGSRQEWKKDRWKFLIIGAGLLVIFIVVCLRCGFVNKVLLECFGAVTAFTYAYFWLFTFFPRRIVLGEDRISIFCGGARQTTAAIQIYYSEIRNVEVVPEGTRYLIRLATDSSKTVDIYATNKNIVDVLSAKVNKPTIK
jgi:hypothetical protein